MYQLLQESVKIHLHRSCHNHLLLRLERLDDARGDVEKIGNDLPRHECEPVGTRRLEHTSTVMMLNQPLRRAEVHKLGRLKQLEEDEGLSRRQVLDVVSVANREDSSISGLRRLLSQINRH